MTAKTTGSLLCVTAHTKTRRTIQQLNIRSLPNCENLSATHNTKLITKEFLLIHEYPNILKRAQQRQTEVTLVVKFEINDYTPKGIVVKKRVAWEFRTGSQIQQYILPRFRKEIEFDPQMRERDEAVQDECIPQERWMGKRPRRTLRERPKPVTRNPLKHKQQRKM